MRGQCIRSYGHHTIKIEKHWLVISRESRNLRNILSTIYALEGDTALKSCDLFSYLYLFFCFEVLAESLSEKRIGPYS